MSREGILLDNFSGGLNNVTDASLIDDNELSEAINVVLTRNGKLMSRPPFSIQTASHRYCNIGTAVAPAPPLRALRCRLRNLLLEGYAALAEGGASARCIVLNGRQVNTAQQQVGTGSGGNA